MYYRLKMYILLLLMTIINIFYNVILIILLMIVFIPMLFWKKTDFDKIHDWLYSIIPDIPDIENPNFKKDE